MQQDGLSRMAFLEKQWAVSGEEVRGEGGLWRSWSRDKLLATKWGNRVCMLMMKAQSTTAKSKQFFSPKAIG